MKTKFFTKFNPPEGRTVDQTGQESRTRQSEKDNCDINKIMERFNRTGRLPTMQSLPPNYGDARVVDYQTAQEIIKDAKTRFNALPAETRKHFGNDPQIYLQALQNATDADVDDFLKLGILIQREPTEKEILTQIAKNTVKPTEN